MIATGVGPDGPSARAQKLATMPQDPCRAVVSGIAAGVPDACVTRQRRGFVIAARRQGR
jgi:hypothetical protein